VTAVISVARAWTAPVLSIMSTVPLVHTTSFFVVRRCVRFFEDLDRALPSNGIKLRLNMTMPDRAIACNVFWRTGRSVLGDTNVWAGVCEEMQKERQCTSPRGVTEGLPTCRATRQNPTRYVGLPLGKRQVALCRLQQRGSVDHPHQSDGMTLDQRISRI